MTLRDDLETEIMFSELRCKKILPTAMAVYKEGLPQHYTQEYHQVGVSLASDLSYVVIPPDLSYLWRLMFHAPLSSRRSSLQQCHCTQCKREVPQVKSWLRC